MPTELDQPESVRRGFAATLADTAEVAIFASCVLYLLTNEIWALVLWEGIAALYLSIGLALVWRPGRVRAGTRGEALAIIRWMWLPPLLAAIAGANSAVNALVARHGLEAGVEATVLAVFASLGIVLSWTLLHVGFAEGYKIIDAATGESGLRFPGGQRPTTLDYLYFSFTLGTSFATSDVEIVGLRTRRVALVHSIVSFFYNALVIAVVFQVLQGIVL